MIVKEFNVQCVWGGTLAGLLLQHDTARTDEIKETVKIICIHGWLDNLNSLLPLAKKLIEHHPDFEIYLYDRAGHGFSSHYARGLEYSNEQGLQDLRVVIKTLGWSEQKYSIIGHSFGAILGMAYSACYPDEVLCLIAIDALFRARLTVDNLWPTIGLNMDSNIQYLTNLSKSYAEELTYEKAVELTKKTRPGITDDAAKLLLERSLRQDADNKLHFSRDPAVKTVSLYPAVDSIVEAMVRSIKASVLFIGACHPQYFTPVKTTELFKIYNPRFEMLFLDGPHHLHMTHIDQVFHRIEEHFNKYLLQPAQHRIENSKL